MKCVICCIEVEKDKMLSFSNGEMICQNCFDSFKNNFEKEESKPVLKEQLIGQIIDESIVDVTNKIQEFSQDKIDMKKFDEIGIAGLIEAVGVMSDPQCIKEYNNIIMEHKKKIDITNIVDFSEICFESKNFQKKLEELNEKASLEILNTEMFGILHKHEFEMFPEDEMYFMIFEENSFSCLDFVLLPYISLIRTVWMFHSTADAEQIFTACLRWSNLNKIKEGFMNDKEKYDRVIMILKKEGPMSKESIQKNIDDIIKGLIDGLK